MEIEPEAEGGAAITIEQDSSTELGRWLGLGFQPPLSADRTVSRRHLSLRAVESGGAMKAVFEVIGRNPILVCHGGGEDKARVYRNSEKGELGVGDRFSLSLENPSFWVVRRWGGAEGAVEQRALDAVVTRERRTLERKEKEMKAKVVVGGGEEEEAVDGELELELSELGVSQIDPFKEFGFLVKGHEFDHYPRHKIRSPKEWNWFLEEIGGNNEDDDEPSDEGNSLKRGRRGKKNKKSGDSEDEDWTSESVDRKEIVELGSTRKSKYATRSKHLKRQRKDDLSGSNEPMKSRDVKHQMDDQVEEDETLGGFIVNDADDDEGDEEELEEEEEEFDEDDDD